MHVALQRSFVRLSLERVCDDQKTLLLHNRLCQFLLILYFIFFSSNKIQWTVSVDACVVFLHFVAGFWAQNRFCASDYETSNSVFECKRKSWLFRLQYFFNSQLVNVLENAFKIKSPATPWRDVRHDIHDELTNYRAWLPSPIRIISSRTKRSMESFARLASKTDSTKDETENNEIYAVQHPLHGNDNTHCDSVKARDWRNFRQ